MTIYSEEINKFTIGLRYEDIPQEVTYRAKLHLLDSLGVALSSSQNPIIKDSIIKTVKDIQANKESTVINSGLVHVLDYDDVYPEMSGHPSAPLVSAIISLGEKENISGKKFLESYIAGFEVQSRIAQVIFPDHDKKGWHSTSTTGVMGAASASAKILNLKPKEINTALGIAASLAGGLRQNFGTMTKPLHVGNASRNGIFAALLAREGFTAYDNIMDATYGYCKVFSGKEDINYKKWSSSFGKPLVLSLPNVGVKKYPFLFCYSPGFRCNFCHTYREQLQL